MTKRFLVIVPKGHLLLDCEGHRNAGQTILTHVASLGRKKGKFLVKRASAKDKSGEEWEVSGITTSKVYGMAVAKEAHEGMFLEKGKNIFLVKPSHTISQNMQGPIISIYEQIELPKEYIGANIVTKKDIVCGGNRMFNPKAIQGFFVNVDDTKDKMFLLKEQVLKQGILLSIEGVERVFKT